MHRTYSRKSSGFTIVELLVVIVIIGILAAITIVAYNGISQRAIVASVQSDLNGAAQQLNLFQTSNSAYPGSISDCPNPAAVNLCLKPSPGNNYIGYSANNSGSPQNFLIIESNSTTTNSTSVAYKVTNNTAPTQLATTMQSGVTPGAVLELEASTANGGITPGVNSPFTTTWADTSGNNNNGTLTNMAGTTSSGWAGSGTGVNPYRALGDGVDDFISVPHTPSIAVGAGDFSLELWYQASADQGGGWYWGVYKGTGDNATYGTEMLIAAQGDNSGNAVWRACIGPWFTDAATYLSSYAVQVISAPAHIVVTRASGITYFYVNGVARGTPQANTQDLSTVTGRWNLLRGPTTTEFAPAAIAIFRQYPFALSATQVAANYFAGPN